MKKSILLSFALLFMSIISQAQVTITPATFAVTDPITITVSFANATCNTMGANPAKVYMHNQFLPLLTIQKVFYRLNVQKIYKMR